MNVKTLAALALMAAVLISGCIAPAAPAAPAVVTQQELNQVLTSANQSQDIASRDISELDRFDISLG